LDRKSLYIVEYNVYNFIDILVTNTRCRTLDTDELDGEMVQWMSSNDGKNEVMIKLSDENLSKSEIKGILKALGLEGMLNQLFPIN